jgi:hypothetical protein
MHNTEFSDFENRRPGPFLTSNSNKFEQTVGITGKTCRQEEIFSDYP